MSRRQYNTEPHTTAFDAYRRCAPVAQRLEQQTHNLLVRGSNPCGGTNQLPRVLTFRLYALNVLLSCCREGTPSLHQLLFNPGSCRSLFRQLENVEGIWRHLAR
jgi:hypothetical protein